MTFGTNRTLFNFFIFALWGTRVILGQNVSSPCPDVFHYERDGDDWSGVVEATSSSYGNNVKLIVVLKYDGSPGDDDIGSIQRTSSDQEVRDAFSRGGTIRYRVPFIIRPAPRLHSIVYNGREICRSQREESRYGITTATREHTVSLVDSTSNSDPMWVRPITVRTTSTRPIIYEPTRPTRPPVVITPIPDSQEPICGVPKEIPNNLVVGGYKAVHREWPWLVALFHYSAVMSSFKCGSTVISARHVITAAHCLYDNHNQLVDKYVPFIVIATSDVSLMNYDEDKSRGLSDMIVHSEYDQMTTVNDLALLVLEAPIDFDSSYVQPACLWDGDDNQDDLVNAKIKGTVVGWGETGSGSSLKEPQRIDVPIVSLTTCRGSHEAFHRLTNDKNLCAGGKDNRGPCNGDSGSGLYIKQNGRWRLRGVVSTSLSSNSLDTKCDLTQYVTYTDVAKHRAWLSNQL